MNKPHAQGEENLLATLPCKKMFRKWKKQEKTRGRSGRQSESEQQVADISTSCGKD